MKIAIAADHAGFALKAEVEKRLAALGHEVLDCGAHAPDPGDDYPSFCAEAAGALSRGEADRAIVIGGSGQGEAIVANRFRGVRCVVYYGGRPEIPTLAREHNDANALSLGARFLSAEEAWAAVSAWLAAPFSGDARHARRLAQIDALSS